MYKLMQKRQEFLCAQIEECLFKMQSAPPGKLEIYQNRNTTKWYIKPDGDQRIYLPKNEHKTAKTMAEKRLAEIRLLILEKELRATKFYMNHYPKERELNKLIEAERLYAPLVRNVNSASWENLPFNANPAFPENLKHPSPSGHLLRSKSECLIDMELFHRNIPFRYECELTLLGEVIYPDFTFFNERTGEYRYWEHFGKMDDLKYRKKAVNKIEQYISCGLIPGRDIFFSYETQDAPLTMPVIDETIDRIEAWLEW